MSDNSATVILAILGIIVMAAAIILWQRRRMRTDTLKDRFGSEYDRTVSTVGDARKAEAILAEREHRVARYTILPLEPKVREHFVATWQRVQAQFVDDPAFAVARADDLLGEVMMARGYPVTDFEHAAEDLSVDHPEVVQNYRKGHEISLRHRSSKVSTEDLRSAMIHFRVLFDDLVNEPDMSGHHGDVFAAARH